MRIEISDDDNGTLKMLMDFDSLSCPSIPLQLQFHHTPTFLRFPKITKPQGMEENLLQL